MYIYIYIQNIYKNFKIEHFKIMKKIYLNLINHFKIMKKNLQQLYACVDYIINYLNMIFPNYT